MAVVRFSYRWTTMGGIDIAVVFNPGGGRIRPSVKERSRTGRHGTDVYVLPNGVYYVALFSRPNGHCRPVYVTFERLIVNNNDATREVIKEEELPQVVVETVRAIYNRLADC